MFYVTCDTYVVILCTVFSKTKNNKIKLLIDDVY